MRAFTSLLAVTGLMIRRSLADCDYQASNVVTTSTGLTADLRLTGSCTQYPADQFGALLDLKLLVELQTDDRLHVKIYDAGLNVYQIQESVIPRPRASATSNPKLKFNIVNNPFSFSVVRTSNGDVLFDTSGTSLVFQSQYVRLRTKLPANPNLYGLGEHSDSFRLQTTGYKRTFWNAESPFLPRKANLYGSHPMYIEHRGSKGTHGVFLLNANGMDINIDVDTSGQQYLEYNTIGGVLDFYFFAGPNPVDVSRQSAEVLGYPAMVPYWTYGFHQCKFGWPNVDYVQTVINNYTAAGIPLEVMWGDIDYMDGRLDFTVDPVNYPLFKMRSLVNGLHKNNQKYVMMLDPGIHRGPNYGTYPRGQDKNVYLKAADGSEYRGKQWAGEVVWPDWFAANTQAWWTNEITTFFDPSTGLDVDGLWNDMNEVSNFCRDTSCNPSARRAVDAPEAAVHISRPRSAPSASLAHRQFQGQQMKGLPGRNLFGGPYRIANHQGDLSGSTLYTNITNADGTSQYDTHNLYGMMMANATRNALLTRRPGKRPFVLSRSTFATAGSKIAHWFGDNYSAWDDYRFSIAQMLAFTSVHQMPFVGSDVCGFNGNAEDKMCARWAMLGAFQPFYRNHADASAPSQEFYRWQLVTDAAKKAIDARYKLLDYMYTALRRASTKGTPVASPVFFMYPNDGNTVGIQAQYFFGPSLLVSPVVDDNATSVTFYLPDDIFYDFWTLQPVRGTGATTTRNNVAFTDIPVHFRGGSIVPMRVASDKTTAAVRTKNFSIMVAAGLDGKATGDLYLDDGESLDGASTDIQMQWDGTTLRADGSFAYSTTTVVESITVMTPQGVRTKKGSWSLNSKFEVVV